MTTEFLHSAQRHPSLCILSPWHIHWILLRMPHWVRHPQTCFSCVEKWHRSSNRLNCLGRLVVGFGWILLQLVFNICPTKDLASCVKWRSGNSFFSFCTGTQNSSGAAALSKAQALLAAASRTCWLLFVTIWFPSLSNFTRLQVVSSCCRLPYDSVLSCLVKVINHNPKLPTAWDVSGMAEKGGAPFFNVQMWADCVCRSSNGDSNWKAVASKASSTCFCKYNYICKKKPVVSGSILTYSAVDWTMTSCG